MKRLTTDQLLVSEQGILIYTTFLCIKYLYTLGLGWGWGGSAMSFFIIIIIIFQQTFCSYFMVLQKCLVISEREREYLYLDGNQIALVVEHMLRIRGSLARIQILVSFVYNSLLKYGFTIIFKRLAFLW